MYKTTLYSIITIILLSVFLTGCSKDDKSTEAFIRLFTSIERPDLRVSGNNFEAGDQIGVYVVPYELGNVRPGTLGQTDYANNIQHIYQSGLWTTVDGDLLPWPGGRKIDIYAYYPYDNTIADPRNYIFTVETDQSVLSSYNKSDFLYARNLNLSESSSVPLIFSHGLSKININIRSEIIPIREAFDDLTNAFIQNIFTTCRLDLANGSVVPDETTSSGEVNTLKLVSPVTNYNLSLTAVVPPQVISASTRLLRINNRGINYFYTTENDITLSQGSTTSFNIDITQQGIIVTTNTINEWNDGGTITGEIGGNPPRILDLDAIDWTQSYVHYIYGTDNTLLGQVCREYLSRNVNPAVDIPAIVVYPLGTNGKMDLTKGFVARVYNRTRNSSTNQYEFSTSNVHGGNAVFGPIDTLYTYTAGSLPLVNKVIIESADAIGAASDNAIPLLTLRPYTLTDIDSNVYPVVKIGTQYWSRENYKVERYTNGQALEYYYYNDNTANKDIYGGLYKWATIVNEAGFTPNGWRVPTRADWNSLYHYVNPDTGRKIKAIGAWSTNANADDVTGFTGLPAGRRTNTGSYNELNTFGQWWSSTNDGTSNAWRIYVGDGAAITENSLGQTYSQSVRLMRDN